MVDDGFEFDSGVDLYAVELFCGTASLSLTAVMRTVMPSSFGVDYQVTKPRSKVIKMDLSDANAQKLILQWVCDPRCVWIHFCVPCTPWPSTFRVEAFSGWIAGSAAFTEQSGQIAGS